MRMRDGQWAMYGNENVADVMPRMRMAPRALMRVRGTAGSIQEEKTTNLVLRVRGALGAVMQVRDFSWQCTREKTTKLEP